MERDTCRGRAGGPGSAGVLVGRWMGSVLTLSLYLFSLLNVHKPRPGPPPYFRSYVAMGNSTSSSSYRTHHEDTVVDFGYLTPQGVYSATKDWKEDVVTQLIIDRKFAPFYRPLEDYDVSWDDDQILAARKDPPAPADQDGTAPRSDAQPPPAKSTHHKRQSVSKELPRSAEAAIYRDAIECPICFLVRHLPRSTVRIYLTHTFSSTTLLTLIIPVAVTRRSARNVLFR
jgi:hypothetical protein